MRSLALAALAVLSISCRAVGQEPSATPAPIDSMVRTLLAETDTYSVEWGPPVAVDASAELEVGSGSGHGGDLTWYRFRPAPAGVDVLAIALRKGRKQYRSKWPPDEVPVTVSRASTDVGGYGALLDRLAMVAGVTVRAKPTNFIITPTGGNGVYNGNGDKAGEHGRAQGARARPPPQSRSRAERSALHCASGSSARRASSARR